MTGFLNCIVTFLKMFFFTINVLKDFQEPFRLKASEFPVTVKNNNEHTVRETFENF